MASARENSSARGRPIPHGILQPQIYNGSHTGEATAKGIIGPSELGLRLDEQAAAQGFLLVSSVIEVWDTRELTGEVLAHIAAWALRAMNDQKQDILSTYHSRRGERVSRLPTTMCVMLIGQKLFISSSARKAPRASWTKAMNPFGLTIEQAKQKSQATNESAKKSSPDALAIGRSYNLFLVQALENSELMAFEDGVVRHQTAANCAEMLCMHLWSLDRRSSEADLDFCNFVTVWRSGGHISVKRPCEGDGCEKVLERLQYDHPDITFATNLNKDLDAMPPELERTLKGEMRYAGVLRETYHYSIIPDPEFVDRSGAMAHQTTVSLERAPRPTDEAYDDKPHDHPPPFERPSFADRLAANWIPAPPRGGKPMRRNSLDWDDYADE